MDIADSRKQMKTTLEKLQSDCRVIDAAFEKLMVAATNVFRLMDGQDKTLLTLQASPKELQGYILNLILEIRKMTSELNEKVAMDLKKTIGQLEEEQGE